MGTWTGRHAGIFVVALAIAWPAYGDVVTDWNTAALSAIRAGRTAPPIAARALAILHVSMFDAINGISRTHAPYAVPSAVPASASTEAAASAAAHVVLVALFPGDTAAFDQLHTRVLAAIPDGPRKSRGVIWGQSVANQILMLRASDHADGVVLPPSGTGPGYWIPTPPVFAGYLLPQWGSVAPFAMPNSAHFRPLGPPPLDSAAYAGAYDEVKALGAAVGSARTDDQTEIALFWADGAGTETPPGHWNSIARDVAAAHGNTLEQNARLFALLNVAMADAGICAWEAKYAFNFWRPVTAIRQGDDDPNSSTAGDPNWSSFIGTPPFPDYVSGHSTFSASAARVLALFYGADEIAFSTGSDFLAGVVRSFPSFSAAAAEAAVSRIYGGIHFRFASDDGVTSGALIGEWVFANVMQPKGNLARN